MTKPAPKLKPDSDIQIIREDGMVWSHIRSKWLVESPEERVRQEYLPILVNEYGFDLSQISEEQEVTGRGSGHARADFVIWRSAQDRLDSKSPLIIVECKADNVTIQSKDYHQGDNYARIAGAPFLVTHNSSETRYWRVVHDKMPKALEEIENIPTADANDKAIEELITRLRIFKEDEFAKVLRKCHNIIRNREKKDPAAAFDEIAKILFVKVWVERELKAKQQAQNIFSVEYLDSQIGDNPLNVLFDQTKSAYETDEIFSSEDRIKLKPSTAREIVKQLERYNLSDTSEDVKGIAFERFLGRTFRGDLGQFFTPRPIVEFMIQMIDPKEGEIVCDPASGSGGFLIRAFELVREQILADADRAYAEVAESIEREQLSDEERGRRLTEAFDAIQEELRADSEGSRMWNLANRCIYGVDADDRMARTSKMNMIMHGDGHGGVHHADGLVNVNGIFEGRFDVILTNPPFGGKVEPSDPVEIEELTSRQIRRYKEIYGTPYSNARARVEAHIGQPITSLFEIPRAKDTAIKSEILFIERCLDLLKPGGRLGIVLPEGILNNATDQYVRDFVESRARIEAVVSIPEGTFKSADADVKPSLLFLRKFTEEQAQEYRHAEEQANAALTQVKDDHEKARSALEEEIKQAKTKKRKNEIKKTLSDLIRQQSAEEREQFSKRLREIVDYPIFMYEAEFVGITSTGAADHNELFPNDQVPPEIQKTCLELFREFRENPDPFLIDLE